MWSLLATALKTTRDKHPGFEARLKTWREANPPKRAHRRTTTRKRPVPADIQDNFYAAMRATTVFDLIYRVRCRQQYQDDSSFLSSEISLRDALAFNRDLKLFTRASLHALEVVIQIAAGQELLDEARDDFRARVGGAIAGLSFDGRLERPVVERAG